MASSLAQCARPLTGATERSETSGRSACEYCDRTSDRPWYDWAEILSTESTAVVAALGSLVAGYVLLLPRRHCHSFLELTEAEYRDAAQLATVVLAMYQEKLGATNFAVFEHGCLSDEETSGCISHAHWHIAPTGLEVSDDQKWNSVSSFDHLRAKFTGGNYLFLNSNGSCVFEMGTTEHQYFRKLLARHLGVPDEWDYLLFPGLANLQRTIELFKPPLI